MTTQPARQSWLTTLGWACYLACSWTWCIGMFLPVLLVRDFGLWGFVVFAVPNVLGAAAMGWVLRPGASEQVTELHRGAIRAFSTVTILFQVFFVFFVVLAVVSNKVHGRADLYGLVVFLVVMVAAAAIRGRWLALVVMVASVSLFAVLVCDPEVVALERASRDWALSPGLLWLAPVCAFGFALCPYLDGTFHRARQSLDAQGARWAFGIGFGVLFAAMILFTLFYRPLFVGDPPVRSWPYAVVQAHLLIQCGFTVGVHLRPHLSPRREPAWQIQRAVLVFVLAALSILWISISLPYHSIVEQPKHVGLEEETVYRCFMAFYGLVFPAYVWLCMIPTRDGHSGTQGRSGRLKLIIWEAAVALAAPAFWMGFIERHTWWLAPGLAVILLARLMLPRRALATV